MAAERGGCSLDAVPLPPEVRESLAELELELSEGESGAEAAKLRGGAVPGHGASASAPGEGRGSRSGLAPLPAAMPGSCRGLRHRRPAPIAAKPCRGAVSECGPAVPLPSSASARRWAAVQRFGSAVRLWPRAAGRTAPLPLERPALPGPADRRWALLLLTVEVCDPKRFVFRFGAVLYRTLQREKGLPWRCSFPGRSGLSLPSGMGESPSPGRFLCDLPVGHLLRHGFGRRICRCAEILSSPPAPCCCVSAL